MTTTAIFVEIVIIGLFGVVWIILLLTRLSILNLTALASVARNAPDWSTLILVGIGAIAYQVGSLINTLCYGLMERVAGTRLRNSILKEDQHVVRATLFSQGSSELIAELNSHLTYIRLSRAAIFNFLLLGITLLTFGTRFWKIAVLSLLISFGSYCLWRIIFVFHHQEQLAAYEVVVRMGSLKAGSAEE